MRPIFKFGGAMTTEAPQSIQPDHDGIGPEFDTGPEFTAFLAEIGQTKHGFARTLKRLGDSRKKTAIERCIQRTAAGRRRITSPMRVIMTIMRNSHRKRLTAAATRGADQP
jgi:hypothetical protein